MTDASPPPPFDPERYRSAAAHYERGRVPYASALIRRVAEVTGLGSGTACSILVVARLRSPAASLRSSAK